VLQTASEFLPWWTSPGLKPIVTEQIDVFISNGRNHGSFGDYNTQKILLINLTGVKMLAINA